jgi:hypothetical protein
MLLFATVVYTTAPASSLPPTGVPGVNKPWREDNHKTSIYTVFEK